MKLSSISFLRLEPSIYEVRSTTGVVLGRVKLRDVLHPDEDHVDETGPNWYVVGGSDRSKYLPEAISVLLMVHNVT